MTSFSIKKNTALLIQGLPPVAASKCINSDCLTFKEGSDPNSINLKQVCGAKGQYEHNNQDPGSQVAQEHHIVKGGNGQGDEEVDCSEPGSR